MSTSFQPDQILPDDDRETVRAKALWYQSLPMQERLDLFCKWCNEAIKRDSSIVERARNKVPTHTDKYLILDIRDLEAPGTLGEGITGDDDA